MDNDLKILLIGPLPPPLSGTTVLVKQLLDDLANHPEVAVKAVDTTRRAGGWRNLLATAISTVGIVIQQARWADVISLHVSMRGSYFGAVLFAVSRITGKPLVYRALGAWDVHYCTKTPGWGKSLLRHTTLRADAVLMETKAAVRVCQSISGQNVHWYSNSRALPKDVAPVARLRKEWPRFMYLGHVTAMKGIYDLLEAAGQITEDVEFDVYGPLLEGVREEDFAGKRVHYKGMLNTDQVHPVMQQYDVLVMPSRRAVEGYPGVVLEAYMAGMAVIATRIGGIPEIVDETSGILVEPGHPDQLAKAMMSLMHSPELLKRLRVGARVAAERFDSHVWTNEFLRICREVIVARTSAAKSGMEKA